MVSLELIVEASEGGFWGRTTYADNLLVDQAETIEMLQENIRKLVVDFHKVSDVTFILSYDLYTFFERYTYLNVSKIAEYAGMNPTLLRHYKSGSKYPSAEQVKRIEDAVHRLAAELATVHLVAA